MVFISVLLNVLPSRINFYTIDFLELIKGFQGKWKQLLMKDSMFGRGKSYLKGERKNSFAAREKCYLSV